MANAGEICICVCGDVSAKFRPIVSRADIDRKAGAKSQQFGRFAPALHADLTHPDGLNASDVTGGDADDEQCKGDAWAQIMRVASHHKVVDPGWQPTPKR